MPTPFIPSSNPAATDADVSNDGWYPDLSVSDFRAQTRLGATWDTDAAKAELQAAMIEINASIAAWRAAQTAQTLAQVPATLYGEESEKVILYRRAVFARARAELLDTTRDYDSTKDGHAQADTLEDTAASWMQQSAEALARLIGRPRMTVELI